MARQFTVIRWVLYAIKFERNAWWMRWQCDANNTNSILLFVHCFLLCHVRLWRNSIYFTDSTIQSVCSSALRLHQNGHFTFLFRSKPIIFVCRSVNSSQAIIIIIICMWNGKFVFMCVEFGRRTGLKSYIRSIHIIVLKLWARCTCNKHEPFILSLKQQQQPQRQRW